MAHRLAAGIALAAIVLAPSAFSLQLLSFLHAKEMVYALAVLALAALSLFHAPARSLPRWPVMLALWLVSMAAIALAMGSHWHAPLEKLVRGLLMLLFFSCAIQALPAAPLFPLRRALVLSGALAGLFGLLQYAHVIEFLLPVFPSYDQRMYSVFGNEDLLGGYMAICLPLAIGLLFDGPKSDRIPAWTALGLMAGALLLSQSRSAWLAATLSCGVLILYAPRYIPSPAGDTLDRRRLSKVLIGAAAIAVLCTAPLWIPRVIQTYSLYDSGGNLRTWFYAGTVHMIRAHPWLGVGLGNFGLNSPYHMGAALLAPGGESLAHNKLFVDRAHCDALETFAETGLAGMLFLMLLLLPVLRGIRPQAARAPELAAIASLVLFASMNPALASAPHALAGLFCCHLTFRTPKHSAPKSSRATILALSLPVTAAGAFLSLLPGYYYVRAEADIQQEMAYRRTHRRPDATFAVSYEIYAGIAGRYHAPAVAFEAAMEAADFYARTNEFPPHRDEVEALLREALRVSDTANLHLAAARFHEAVGDAELARQSMQKVYERWPDLGPDSKE